MLKNMASIELEPSPRMKARVQAEEDVGVSDLFSTEQEPMMALKWYHPNLTRHTADCMLIDNAPEGSYLLRPSSNYDIDGSYVLSIKLSSSVQHIKVTRTESHGYRFGNSTFKNVEGFRKHIEFEKPVIGGDSGVTVVLKHPYSRYIDEKHMYTDIVHHAVTNMIDSSSDSESELLVESEGTDSIMKGAAISSKEGYLTKQGRFPKTWRVRWFVLRNQFLSYYKTKQSPKPIDTLDLFNATLVEYDNSKSKDFCFRIEFQRRTYYFYANSVEDCQNWVELLRSKIGSSST